MLVREIIVIDLSVLEINNIIVLPKQKRKNIKLMVPDSRALKV